MVDPLILSHEESTRVGQEFEKDPGTIADKYPQDYPLDAHSSAVYNEISIRFDLFELSKLDQNRSVFRTMKAPNCKSSELKRSEL